MIMKRFYMILAALLIGSVCFAQKAQGPALQVKAQTPNQTRSGYYNYWEDDGSGYVGINTWEAGDKLAARYPVSALASLGANPKVTKVGLYFVDYQTYTNKSANIVVYQGGVFDETEGYYTTAPTQVYSQPVTATEQGITEFTLTTPVNIDVTQELMIAVEMTGNTCYVMAHGDVPSAENLGNIMWYTEEGFEGWVAMDFYTDNTHTTTACSPWYINVYIEDENAYVENSDISVGFMDVYPNPTEYSISTLNIGTTDDLVVYPYIMNNGPDAVPTDQTVNVTITINGVNPYGEVIPMQWNDAFGSGYFSPVQVSEAYGLTFAASDLDALGVPSEFDVCITAAYTGVDNNSANNSTCLHVTRGGSTPTINCDLEAMLFNDQQGTSAVGSTITLAPEDDLAIYGAIKNNGPDDANTGTVTMSISMDGTTINSQNVPLTQYAIANGQTAILAQIGLDHAQMDQLGISGTFEICFNISFNGDSNSANNSKCVTITRNTNAVEENIAEAVSVYPNPANDMFTVANAEGATIVVVNSLGQVVASIENAASNQTIDASSFANGTYFVKVNESVIKINVVK